MTHQNIGAIASSEIEKKAKGKTCRFDLQAEIEEIQKKSTKTLL